ncbi:amino acid adenylation domain-containing protein [Nonomuraea sp. B12E4]|uniref:non-ribosomal peptide synthetase n=1 Tax=Nonomuraea sp. B12E4 TaxID=3153564 RepID=UPI00325C4DBF
MSDAARRALLERLLRGGGTGDGIPRRDPGEAVPLLPAQRRVWLADRLSGSGPVYHVYVAARLDGDLDVEALRAALGDLALRHEALRTTFEMDGDEVVQVVAETGSVPLTVTSVGAIGDRLAAAARAPFPPGAPQVRAELFVGEQTHLILVAHHLLADGWSLRVLVGDLSALYLARRHGTAAAPSPARIGAADAACWAARRPTPPEGLRFWIGNLAAPLPVLDLPANGPRPQVATHAGAQVALTLTPELTATVRRTAAASGTTVFLLLLSAFAVLLHRWTGQDEVVIGVPVSRRDHEDLHGVAGLFATTVALRVAVPDDADPAGLVSRVRELFLAAHRHAEIPFDEVVRALDPPRDPSRNPLFQASFVMEEEPVELNRLGDLTVTPVPVHNGTAKFDMSLFVTDRGERLELTLEHAVDVIAEGVPEQLLKSFRDLLSGASTPDPLAGPVTPERPAGGVHLLVRSSPHVALETGDLQVTYAELVARSERLAGGLRAAGVGPGSVVGLRLPRGVDLVMGALAVWQAGGAFLGVDPSYPAERSRRMIEHAGVSLVLTPERLRALDGEGPPEAEAAETEADGADLAYIVQTSGSSGLPKGVMTTHAGAVNYLSYVVEEYGLGPGDVVLQVPSIAYDSAVRDSFATLAAGARLVVGVPSGDPRALLAAIRAHRVTCLLSVVPTLLAELAEAASGEPMALRLVLVSGERLRWDDLRRARERLAPEATFVNQYGPTETTMTAAFRKVAPDEEGTGDVPVGRLIPHLDALILDRRLRPVPAGAPGELYLGGTGLARGYANDPALTAARFVAGLGGRRYYRTGDRVRLLPCGDLVFLGRTDSLVKRHGVRIDPGEIEAALRTAPGVRDAAVTAGERALTAYVTGDPAVTATGLLAHLRTLLPPAMLPSALHMLPALPRTPNGKIDRGVLRPEPATALAAGTGRLPETRCEIELAEVWSELLGITEIPADADFFALGGHSLTAVVLADQLARRWGVPVTPADVLAHPTVALLAARLDGRRDSGRAVRLRDGDGPPLFLVHPLSGDLLCYRHLVAALPPGRPVHGFQSVGSPPATVAELAARYAADVRRIRPEGSFDLAGWSFGGIVAVEMARLLGGTAGGVRTLALLDTSPEEETEDTTEEEARLIIADTGLVGALADTLVGALLANARARRGHRFEGPPLDVDLVLVQASLEHPVLPARRMTDPAAWRARTTGRTRYLSLSADHYGLLAAEHATALAEILNPVAPPAAAGEATGAGGRSPQQEAQA